MDLRMQVYFSAIRAAFYRQGMSIDEVLELSKKVASAYSGFVPQASKAAAHIVILGISSVFQVRLLEGL